MKLRHNIYLKINLASVFFIALSFISVTLAWFAYSGLSSVSTDIGVKAWNIELDRNGSEASNEIYISLSEIYPGMEIMKEIVNIRNSGDSDAKLSYSIVSARILGDSKDNYVIDGVNVKSDYVEDALSHNYPFHININLSKEFIPAKGGTGSFEVSISWPLDSEDNEIDSLWGNAAFQFQQNEAGMEGDNYQIRPAIQVVLTLTAEQYVKGDNASDPKYRLGDTILFDVESNQKCTTISSTCLETYVIDINNRSGDETVTLLPNPLNHTLLRVGQVLKIPTTESVSMPPAPGEYIEYTVQSGDNLNAMAQQYNTTINEILRINNLASNYNYYNTALSDLTEDWAVTTRPLLVEDILKIISKDVIDSYLIRENISDAIIGNLNYQNRMTTEINRATSYNGYYSFINQKFNFLSSNNCYWTSSQYNINNAFAIKNIDENSSKIYGESKTTICNVVPVILANKNNL